MHALQSPRKFIQRLGGFLAAALVAVTVGTAQAQTVIWDGSIDTDWSAAPDATSWGGGVDTTYNDGDAAQFNGAGAGTVNITGSVSPSSVSVTSGSYTFADGGGGIGGAGALNKSGGGTLTIRSANTFTGGVNLSGGSIDIRDNANEQSFFGAAGNTVTFTGDAEIYNSANTVTLPQNFTINNGVTGTFRGNFAEHIDVNGVLAGTGTLVAQGGSAGPSFDFLNTGNTFSGPIKVLSGDSASLGMASLNDAAAAPGTTIELQSNSNNGTLLIYKNAIAPLVLNNYQFELVVNGNTTDLNRSPGIQVSSQSVTVNNDLLVTGTGTKWFRLLGNNGTFAGAIPNGVSGDLELYVQGGWTLSGNNTYEGKTTVGTSSSGGTTVTIGGSGVLGGGNYAGNILIERNDTLRFNSTASQTLSGIISDNAGFNDGKLIKDNTGTLTLTGANSYDGATTIDGGTLLINGTTGTGAVNVSAGGTLGGTGTISGTATVAGSATVSPGTSWGTLLVNNLTMQNGSVYYYESGPDLIDVTNTLDLQNPWTLQLAPWLQKESGKTFELFQYGSLAGGTFTTPTIDFSLTDFADASGITFNDTGSSIQVIGLAIPEPSSMVLLAGLLAGLAAVARRRHR